MQYTKINEDTVKLKFFGSIGMWYQGADDFTYTFSILEKEFKNIIIDVHCYGGYVTEGNVIFNSINNSKAHVTYNIVGVSASMSSICQLAADDIAIAENGFVMVHRPSSMAGGNADDMFASGKLLKSMEKNFLKVYARRTGKSEAECQKWLNGADHWFDAEEALALGLVDRIIPAVVKNINELQKPTTDTGAAALYSNFTASLAGEIPTDLQTNLYNMKKLLIAAFALQGVDENSSDTAITEALKAQAEAKDKRIKELQDAAKAVTDQQIDMMIANAESTIGEKFDEARKATLKAIGTENGANVLSMALSFIPATAAVEQPAGEGGGTTAPKALDYISKEAKGASAITAERKDWTWSKWCDEDEAGLLALAKETQNEIYKRSYGEDMPS